MDLKSYLHARLRTVAQDWARTPDVAAAAPKAQVLPLLAEWSGYWGLLEDASVVFVDYDEPHVRRPEPTVRLRNIALFRGAQRYPELAGLVPRRGEDDDTCPGCGGTGIEPKYGSRLKNVVCFCGGLGWVPRGDHL